MKKLMMPLFLVTLLLAACGGESDNEVAEIPGHLVTGEIANADGQDVVLIVFEDEAERVVDTVKIENGKFEIQTDTKELRQYILLVGEQEMPMILILDEACKDVIVTGELPGIVIIMRIQDQLKVNL